MYRCTDGPKLDGFREPIICSFALDNPPGLKFFCEPETIQYKEVNKLALNNFSFDLKTDESNKVDFNGETLAFTLLLI